MPWIKVLSFVIIFLLSENNVALSSQIEGFEKQIIRLGVRVGYDTVYILTSPLRMNTKSMKKLILFSGITYGLMSMENKIRKVLIDMNYEKIGDIVEPLGVSNRNFYLAVGILYTYGVVFNNTKIKETAGLVIEAVLFNDALTRFFKYTCGRPRPKVHKGDWDDFIPFSGHDAFPSGHTSTAFTLATVISRQYPSWFVKVSSYTIAGLIGLQRLYVNAHGIADIFAGAILGIWIGDTICKLDKRWGEGDIHISFDRLVIKF
jgi:membrane-associated phospholipid phosphatase